MEKEEKIKAIMNRDSSYDGKFYYGVKSTGIVCKPSCKAKNPHEKKHRTIRYIRTGNRRRFQTMQNLYEALKCYSDTALPFSMRGFDTRFISRQTLSV